MMEENQIVITKRRKGRVQDYVGTITLTGDGKQILLPTTANDNKRMAQVEAARLGAFINEWMKDNHNNISELKPAQLKDLAMALKTKQELAEKAYGPNQGEGEGGRSTDDVAQAAAKAVEWLIRSQDKRKQSDEAIEVEVEDA